MNKITTCNYVVGALGVHIGGLIMWAAAAFPLNFTENGPGPGFWPFSLGTALLLTALLLLVYTFIKRGELSAQQVALTTSANKRVYMMMGLVVVFCALISLVGFYPASIVLIIGVMLIMDYRNTKVIAATTAGVLLFIYLVFGMLLRTQMPQSIFLQ